MQPTNKQLADAIGVSQSMASRIRNGQRLPSIAVMNRIASYFDVDLLRLVNTHEQGRAAFGALIRELLAKREM